MLGKSDLIGIVYFKNYCVAKYNEMEYQPRCFIMLLQHPGLFVHSLICFCTLNLKYRMLAVFASLVDTFELGITCNFVNYI